MTWILILTIWTNGPHTLTVTGFRSQAECQRAVQEWRDAVGSQPLKFTTCVERRPA